MHSVANLATLQTPLVTFFPSKKCPNLVSENHRYCRTSAWSCSPSARAHLSLSASAQLLSQRAHTPLSLSLCVCSVSLPARTHLSLSLCVYSVSLPARAHTSLSLSVRLLSFSPSARTPLSLSLSLSLCVCSVSLQRAAERNSASVKHRYDVASLILHASIAEITAQLLSLSYVYLISSDDGAIIRIFVQINILEVRAS